MNVSNWTFGGILLATLLFIFRPGCELPNPGAVGVRDYYPPSPNPGVASTPSTNPDNRSIIPVQTVSAGNRTPSSIIIGSFNIQSFGPTKASRPHVMEKLVDIARRYDLLAIQELRNEDQSVIERFVDQVNSDGSRYSYIVGPRQGYTNHKEQYAFLFDASKFRLASNPYVIADPNGTMHRPPLVASFECTQAPRGSGFSFTALNLHVDPDMVESEFAALHAFMPDLFENHRGEDDFIILGDFNHSARGIQNVRFMQNQLPLIRENWATKIRSGRSIDNIVIDGIRTAEYANQSGVLNIQHQYRLSTEETLLVSDHFPVWAVFSTVEAADRFVWNDPSALPIR